MAKIGIKWFGLVLTLGFWIGAGTDLPAEDNQDYGKKALSLNRISGEKAADGEIASLQKKAEETKKLLSAAAELAKDRKNQPFNINATYILARTAQELKQVDISQTFYEIQIDQAKALESAQRLAVAYWGLIKLLIDNGKPEESQKVYKKFLEVEGDEKIDLFKIRVERLMILALARNEKLNEALQIIDKKIKADEKNWGYLDLKARAYREAGKFENSAKTYDTLIEGLKKDTNLKDEVRDELISACRYSLSSILVDMKEIDKAADQLKELLSKDPTNPTYNNDLGFIYADHNMNLEESEKMIRKAIQEDRKQQEKLKNEKPDEFIGEVRDNPSFLDSLGWVLYRQKKFKEAKPYLIKATEGEEGQNIEIYDHLGDVLLALGEKKEAVAAWKKGLEIVGTTLRDAKRKVLVEKKIMENDK